MQYGQKVFVREFDNVNLNWTPWVAAYVVDSTYFYGAVRGCDLAFVALALTVPHIL